MAQMIPTVISDAAGRSLAYQFVQASFSVAPAGSSSEEMVMVGKFARLAVEIHNKGVSALTAMAVEGQIHPSSGWMSYVSSAELSAGTALAGRLVNVLTANPTTLAADGRSRIILETAGLHAVRLTIARAGIVAEDVDLWSNASRGGNSGGGGAAAAYVEDPGSLKAFAMAPPTGWLDCNGAAVSRTTYANLFTAIGTVWGVGDGSTTFNLPDFRGRTIIGVGTGTGLTARALAANVGTETHQLTTAEMPAHTHPLGYSVAAEKSGAAWAQGSDVGSIVATGSSGSGTAHANMQPSAAAWIGIKT